jgi:hypothetical protein
MALGMAVFTPLARAGATINIDPTGGGGANPNNVLAAAGFSWAPGNTVAIGGSGLTAASVGTNVTLLYDAYIATIPTVGTNTASIGSNNGNITILTPAVNNTGQQFVIAAQFTETIATVSGGTVTFTPNLGLGANSVRIWAQSSGNANSVTNTDPTALGFPPNASPPNQTLILTGSIIGGPSFTSSFTENTASDPRLGGSPVPLNGFGGGTYPATTTITGTGNTGLIVNVSSVNPSFFLSPPTVLQLNFSQGISTGVPFNNVTPQTTLPSSFGGGTYNPAVGAVNGASPGDFLFQSQAANNFSVPEPSTISMACTAAGVVSLAGFWRRRRARTARP